MFTPIVIALIFVICYVTYIGTKKFWTGWAMKKARPTSNVTPAVTPQPVTPTGEIKKVMVYVWRYGLTYLLYMIMILFCLSIALSFLGPIFSLICYVGAGSPKPISQSSQTQAQSSEKIITVTGEWSKAFPVKDASYRHYLYFDIIEPVESQILFSDVTGKTKTHNIRQKSSYDENKSSWIKFKKQGENDVKVRIWYE